jgi:hypothetical protein
MTTCGAVKVVNGRSDPLVCNLDPDHDPRVHGMRLASGLDPFVRWGEGIRWTAEDERARQRRYTWHKPHVRRKYQTLSMWKAGR